MLDPFTPRPREIKQSTHSLIKDINADAWALLQKFPVGTRNATLARYKLEEAIMWVVKDLTT